MPELTIDGQTWEVREGRNVLAAALDQKLDLPYFCWHPAMGSVGACRLCAVKQYRDETDRDGRIVMACMTPVNDDTRVSIADPEAAQFRRSVIEWLMINHPHDCPVCDEGGECHLQDMTVMAGHAHRRYRGRKRTFRNQYLGPLIHHEMNRCITCYRCTRFYQDHAGGDDLRAFASRNRVYFGRVEEGTLESPFSGNLVEVCPTGVFTDRTYRRHYVRKWDLQSTPSVCSHCGLGCNTLPAARYGTLRRVTTRYNHEVNGYWLCDRGRFGYEHVNAVDRLSHPQVREADEGGRPGGPGRRAPAGRDGPAGGRADDRNPRRDLSIADPLEAWDRASRAVTRAARAGTLAAVGSPRAALEGNFALQRLVGPERFCPGTAPVERRLLERAVELYGRAALRAPSLREMREADAVLVLGADPTGEAPLVDMALVQACKQGGAGLALVHGRPARLSPFARIDLRLDPDAAARLGNAIAGILERDGGAGTPEGAATAAGKTFDEPGPGAELDGDALQAAETIAGMLAGAERPLVVTGTGARRPALLDAAARVALAARTPGSSPAATPGSSPAAAPGSDGGPPPGLLALLVPEPDSLGVTLLDGGRGPGIDDLLDAVESGQVDTLVVLENDLFARTDDPERLALALEHLESLVVLDHMVTSTAALAYVALPVATTAESNGTFVSGEGRAQRFWQAVEPVGDAASAWSLIRDLTVELRAEPGGEDEVADTGAGVSTRNGSHGRGDGPGSWKIHVDVLESLAAERPVLAPALEVAPPPGYRAVHQRIPRFPQRSSGRTAAPENDDVHRAPQPPEDTDSPFAWSMEGYQGQPPPALLPRFWTPGWNSNEAINQFQIEVGGPLHGGDPGRRLLEPPERPGSTLADLATPDRGTSRTTPEAGATAAGALHAGPESGDHGGGDPPTETAPVPDRHAVPDGALLLCAAHEVFGSEPTSRRARGVAEMTPPPYLTLHPEAAAAAGLEAGVTYHLRLREPDASTEDDARPGTRETRLTVEVEEALPRHLALLPAGYPETRWWQEPVAVEIEAVEPVEAPEPLEAPPGRDPRGRDTRQGAGRGRGGGDAHGPGRRGDRATGGRSASRRPVQIETPGNGGAT